MKIRRFFPLLLAGFCFSPVLCAQIPSVLITAVKFEGNRSISSLQLRNRLRNSQEGMQYSAENLKADLQRVEQAYLDEGFLNVKVGSPEVQIRAIGADKGAVIRIPVTEGARYSVGQVAVREVQSLPPASLLQLCPLQKGQPYNRIKIAQWQERIEDEFRAIGYLRIRCAAHEALNETEKTVGCAMECAEGKQYSVGRIAVVADESIDRLQFKRRLLLGEGGIFNPEMLVLSIQFLNQTGFYKPISDSDVKIDIDDAKGTVDLTWHLFK